MQTGCGHGKDLDIHPTFIHQRQSPFTQVVEPCFDLAMVKPIGAFLPEGGCRLGGTDVGAQKVLLDADELCHGLHLF